MIVKLNNVKMQKLIYNNFQKKFIKEVYKNYYNLNNKHLNLLQIYFNN